MDNVIKKILLLLFLTILILTLFTTDYLIGERYKGEDNINSKITLIDEELNLYINALVKDNNLSKFPSDYENIVKTLNIPLTQHQKTSLLLYGESSIKTNYKNITDAYTYLIEKGLPLLIPPQYIDIYIENLIQDTFEKEYTYPQDLNTYEEYIDTQFENYLQKVSIKPIEIEEDIEIQNEYIIDLNESSIKNAYYKCREKKERKYLTTIINDFVILKKNPSDFNAKARINKILGNILLNSNLNIQGEIYWKLTIIDGKTYVYPIYMSEEFVINDENFNDPYDIEPIIQRNNSVRIPILMYHQINQIPEGSNFLQGLYVTPEIFEQQLAYLVKKNYKSITPEEFYNILKTGKNPSQKSIMLTFDDGTSSQYLNAYPLLKKYGLTGVFYVVSNKSSIKYGQLREMHSNGMIIDSHSATHKDLTKTSNKDVLHSEIVGSRNTLRNYIGGDVYSIAYPGCVIDSKGLPYVSQAGYLIGGSCGRSIDHSFNQRYSLSRVHVFSSMENLKNILSGKP